MELVKIRLHLGFRLRPRENESHALTAQQRRLNKTQILAKNKAENRCFEFSNATDRDYSKCHQINEQISWTLSTYKLD